MRIRAHTSTRSHGTEEDNVQYYMCNDVILPSLIIPPWKDHYWRGYSLCGVDGIDGRGKRMYEAYSSLFIADRN